MQSDLHDIVHVSHMCVHTCACISLCVYTLYRGRERGKEGRNVCMYIYYTCSLTSLVPRLPPLRVQLLRDLFPCECEFKGHAIIARARGGSLGTRLQSDLHVHVSHMSIHYTEGQREGRRGGMYIYYTLLDLSSYTLLCTERV